MIEAGIFSYLQTKTTVTSVVGRNVFPLKAAQDTDWPFVVYTRTNTEVDRTLKGASGLIKATFQFDCWSDDYSEAKDLTIRVRQALESYTGTMGTHTVQGCFVQNETESFINNADIGQDTAIYAGSLDVDVWYVDITVT